MIVSKDTETRISSIIISIQHFAASPICVIREEKYKKCINIRRTEFKKKLFSNDWLMFWTILKKIHMSY